MKTKNQRLNRLTSDLADMLEANEITSGYTIEDANDLIDELAQDFDSDPEEIIETLSGILNRDAMEFLTESEDDISNPKSPVGVRKASSPSLIAFANAWRELGAEVTNEVECLMAGNTNVNATLIEEAKASLEGMNQEIDRAIEAYLNSEECMGWEA